MADDADEFLTLLNIEETEIVKVLREDSIGVSLVASIKEYASYYYQIYSKSMNYEDDFKFQMLRFGMPKFISASLSTHKAFRYPTITFRSDEALRRDVFSLITRYGVIEHGRRFAYAAKAGECSIERQDARIFNVILPKEIYHMEDHEASVLRHYEAASLAAAEVAIKRRFNDTPTYIKALIDESVFVFKDHFIGYNAHPDLDDWFFGRAYIYLQHQNGYDTFNYKLTFGGVTVQQYTLAVAYLFSLSLKHEAFVDGLIAKEPNIRLNDVAVITADRAGFQDDLMTAVNRYGPSFDQFTPIDAQQAKTIIDVLSLRRDNIDMTKPIMAPLPFLVEFSDTSWVKVGGSANSDACRFLLNSLRYHFPRDYDRHQQTRERSMQRAIHRLVEEFIDDLVFTENIKIARDGKTLTDIDFAIFDPKDGTVVLFQLKHQDEYGGDMRQRSNRGGRFRSEVDSWLEATRSWLRDFPTELPRALRLRRGLACRRVRLLIIGRHFAHFANGADLREDAAYATFPQFYDALNRQRAEGVQRSLSALFELLREFMTHNVVQPTSQTEEETYHLQHLSFGLRSA